MLTEKYKDFIEATALEIQGCFETTKVPNKYDYSEVIRKMQSLGAKFEQAEDNYTEENTIYLSFYDPCNFEMFETSIENRKKFFHEIWHFISNKIDALQDYPVQEKECRVCPDHYTVASNNVLEIAANYFTRAMLLPESHFLKSIMKNLNISGACNIFQVAKEFDVSYIDVIARGNDLNIWNTKVGKQ